MRRVFALMVLISALAGLVTLHHLQVSAGNDYSTLTPLALAIVFPQFHPIPENDELWGINFTEWTYLKPMPRYVYDEVIYKPHPELGYYNILDFEHRRFMRVLADRFGIYGFCIYHFWFKDHPGMCYPTSMGKEA